MHSISLQVMYFMAGLQRLVSGKLVAGLERM